MKKTLLPFVALFIAILATGSLLADEKVVHRGEIMGVDKDARTLTVKIKVEGLDKKETRVYHVTPKTVILDADDKPITFADLKAGQKVRVKSQRKERQHQALEIGIRPEKDKN